MSTVVPDNIITILENGDGKTRWSLALKAALNQGLAPEVIRQIVVWFEPASNDLADKFAWLDILEEVGYSSEQLAELMLAWFKGEDPNIDLPAERRRQFLRHPPAWRVASDDNLAEFVMAEASDNPTEVLALNNQLAERLGQREADRLAVLASRHVNGLDEASAATVMRLGGKSLLGVAQCMAIRSIRNQVGIFRLCELAVLVHAAMEVGDRRDNEAVDIWLGLSWTIEWPGREPDPDRPFRVFRWMLRFAEEAPFKVEAWMRGNTPPNEVKQCRHEDFVEHLRRIMNELGYGFARMRQTEHNGQRQFAAIVTDRGGELKFVEANRPSARGDTIQDGTEVIVPLRPEGKPAFAYRGGRGFITNLHPVAPPTPAMEAEVKANHNCL